MSEPSGALWVYLGESPLAALTLTLVVYLGCHGLWDRLGRPALLNPVLVAIVLIASVLLAAGINYATYFEGAQFVHFLLGPATVALALPFYRELERLRRSALGLTVAVLCGSASAVLVAVGLAWVAGATPEILASLAPKSVTTPVAMSISQELGGVPSLTAALVVLTGIVGAVLGPAVLDLAKIRDARARGFALGLAAHGVGTARALQAGQTAGAFAGIAIGANAVVTATLLPLLWRLVADGG
ncbi:MAG: LrgB family protein [Pseudomonadota bacterium]